MKNEQNEIVCNKAETADKDYNNGKCAGRKHYIDNIRWTTVVLVIVYHAIYMFNSLGIITNLAEPGIPEMDFLGAIVYPWFMVLLFVVAGMSARYSLEKRGSKTFAKDRTLKLLIPSFAIILLFGWVNGWITDLEIDMFKDAPVEVPGIIKFAIYCMSGIGPLWFARELFFASMLLLLIRKIDKKDKLYELGGKANIIVLIALFVAVWISSFLFNTPIIEVYRNGIYFFTFFLGYYVFSHEEVTDKLVKWKIPLLIATVLAGVGYGLLFYGENYTTKECLRHIVTNLYCWLAVLAIIGCFKAWFNRTNAFATYMTKANFAFYVLHYTVMLVYAYLWVRNTDFPLIWHYIVPLTATLITLPVLYEILKRIPVLRFLILGITKPAKKKEVKEEKASKND